MTRFPLWFFTFFVLVLVSMSLALGLVMLAGMESSAFLAVSAVEFGFLLMVFIVAAGLGSRIFAKEGMRHTLAEFDRLNHQVYLLTQDVNARNRYIQTLETQLARAQQQPVPPRPVKTQTVELVPPTPTPTYTTHQASGATGTHPAVEAENLFQPPRYHAGYTYQPPMQGGGESAQPSWENEQQAARKPFQGRRPFV